MAMDFLQQLRIFVRVAEAGGFARAADQLGLAASTVTAAVQRLERALATELFQRTTRSVRLTPDGEQLQERALRLLADADETRSLFAQDGHRARGRLRVEAPARMVSGLLAPALPALLDAHPQLDLELNSSDRLSDLVEAGIDCVLRVGRVVDAPLVAHPLGTLAQLTCASPQLVDRLGLPSSPTELARYPAVHYGGLPPGGRDDWELQHAGGLVLVPMSGRVSVNSTESYIACALAGLGAIQAPAYDLRAELAAGRLVPLLPQSPPPGLPVQVMYPSQRRLSHRLRVFIDWLAPLLAAAQAQPAQNAA